MRELLKYMLRIFIAEYILYKLSIFIIFFLDGPIPPQNISNSTAMLLALCPPDIDPILSREIYCFYI